VHATDKGSISIGNKMSFSKS